MRSLPKRGQLAKDLKARLKVETEAICRAADSKVEAERRYDKARQTQWFRPVVDKLKRLSGKGQRCMYCSGSEASDVEHYRPKAVFPLLTMTWENYLWICSPCNRHKGDRFPPITEPGGEFVNPLQDDVWRFFFIDEFGFLSPIYDRNLGVLNPRGVSTRDFIDLNREAVQQSRLARLKDLKAQTRDIIRQLKSNQISKAVAKRKIQEWKRQPFQPDVADYFLNGPGRLESPFKDLLSRL